MEKAVFKAPNRPEKISNQIIDQIRDMVLAGELKPGDKLGSEKSLIAQFGVSKGTLREALRVLEAMGLVETRKGLAGGVFIAEVDMKTTTHSIINFLHFKAVSIKDITMLRFFVEPFIVRIATLQATDEDLRKLRSLVEDEVGEPRNDGGKGEIQKGISFHRYLARLTHNPILILIMDFVDNLLADMKSQLNLGPEFYENVKKRHRLILEHMARRDPDSAEKEILNDLLDVGKAMSKLSGTKEFDPAILELSHRDFTAPLTELQEAPVSSTTPTSHLSDLIGECMSSETPSESFVLKRVGSGDLYLVVMKNKNKLNTDEI